MNPEFQLYHFYNKNLVIGVAKNGVNKLNSQPTHISNIDITVHIQKLIQKSQSSIFAIKLTPILSKKSLSLYLSPVLPRNKMIKAANRAINVV